MKNDKTLYSTLFAYLSALRQNAGFRLGCQENHTLGMFRFVNWLPMCWMRLRQS